MGAFLGRLILGLVLNYISFLLTPVPPGPKPAQLKDFKIPVAKEGATAGVVMGTAWIKNPQVVDYGDLKIVPIRKGGGKK